MRLIILTAGLVALAGCGQSDAKAREEAQKGIADGCKLEGPSAGDLPPSLDKERLCDCSAAALVRGKSAEQLAQMKAGRLAMTPQETQQIGLQCMREQGFVATGPARPESASNSAAETGSN